MRQPYGRIAVQLALIKENIYWVVKGEDILGGARLSAPHHSLPHWPYNRDTGDSTPVQPALLKENIYWVVRA